MERRGHAGTTRRRTLLARAAAALVGVAVAVGCAHLVQRDGAAPRSGVCCAAMLGAASCIFCRASPSSVPAPLTMGRGCTSDQIRPRQTNAY